MKTHLAVETGLDDNNWIVAWDVLPLNETLHDTFFSLGVCISVWWTISQGWRIQAPQRPHVKRSQMMCWVTGWGSAYCWPPVRCWLSAGAWAPGWFGSLASWAFIGMLDCPVWWSDWGSGVLDRSSTDMELWLESMLVPSDIGSQEDAVLGSESTSIFSTSPVSTLSMLNGDGGEVEDSIEYTQRESDRRWETQTRSFTNNTALAHAICSDVNFTWQWSAKVVCGAKTQLWSLVARLPTIFIYQLIYLNVPSLN